MTEALVLFDCPPPAVLIDDALPMFAKKQIMVWLAFEPWLVIPFIS
jgi:hypothetical protein